MTAAKLKELEAKAMDGLHVVDYANFELVAIDGGVYKYVASFDPNEFSNITLTDDEIAANAKLYCYLRNHCKDFIRLMEAAELIQGILDHPTKSVTILDSAKLREALAAFKEKS